MAYDRKRDLKPVVSSPKVHRDVTCIEDIEGWMDVPSKHCKLLHWFRCMLCEPYTPWKFNIAFENGPFQKEGSLPTIIFQGRTIKLRGWMNQTHKICVFCFTFF